MIMVDSVGKDLKKAVVAYFKLISLNSLMRRSKTTKNLGQGSQ
jgi:hypothetical protein